MPRSEHGEKPTTNNIAVYLLVGRPSMAVETLKMFRSKTSGLLANAPIFAFFLPGSLDKAQIAELERCVSRISVRPITPPFPRFHKGEMFYSRKSRYARRFPKSRLGYLDMCYWTSNPRHEAVLDPFEALLRIDDDSEFIGDVGPAVEVWLESGSSFGSAKVWSHVTTNTIETREQLFRFIKDYCARYQISPKYDPLNELLLENNETEFHSLGWSVGNFNLYRNKVFSTPMWDSFIRQVQEFGGAHRFRWADIEVIGLFFYIYFGQMPSDLGLVNSGLYKERNSSARYISTRN